VDDELRQGGGAVLALAAVPEQQVLQVFELCDGEIRRQRRLFPFLSEDTYANMWLLDHSNIITTVADWQS